MSFKGFTKSIVRAPQSFKAKFNLGENTKDPVFIDAERRFQELETETKRLHDESKKYFEAITGMMTHQIGFSQAIAEIYKPISGRVSDPDSLIPEGNPEGIAACEEYESICKDLLETLQPELEMIDTRVIRPADELLAVIKVIRKTITKRQHKQLDYDRHRANLKKLQDKKDKSLKDEKAMYKAENEAEQATTEFDYFNDLLKEELPKLFGLEREFIKPLFQSFYYMQLNVFYTLHERMQGCDIGYFNLQKSIEEGFEEKRGDVREQAEALSIVKFKTANAKRNPKLGPGVGNRLGIEDRTSRLTITDGRSSSVTSDTRRSSTEFAGTAPPPYSPTSNSIAGANLNEKSGIGRANSVNSQWTTRGGKAAPPPPKAKPSRLSGVPAAETVTALYDYEAQAEGDLSFTTGDVIEIIHRTDNENEWWTGKCNGKQGQFPGNYVVLNQ